MNIVRKQDSATQLRWLVKRLPGRKPIDDLERIACYLGADPEGEDDAARLLRLAERLRLIRWTMRGYGRWENDGRLTREAMARMAEEDGRPFDEDTVRAEFTADMMAQLTDDAGDPVCPDHGPYEGTCWGCWSADLAVERALEERAERRDDQGFTRADLG